MPKDLPPGRATPSGTGRRATAVQIIGVFRHRVHQGLRAPGRARHRPRIGAPRSTHPKTPRQVQRRGLRRHEIPSEIGPGPVRRPHVRTDTRRPSVSTAGSGTAHVGRDVRTRRRPGPTAHPGHIPTIIVIAAKRVIALHPAISRYSPQPDNRRIPQNSQSSLLPVLAVLYTHYSGHSRDSFAARHFVTPARRSVGWKRITTSCRRGSTGLGSDAGVARPCGAGPRLRTALPGAGPGRDSAAAGRHGVAAPRGPRAGAQRADRAAGERPRAGRRAVRQAPEWAEGLAEHIESFGERVKPVAEPLPALWADVGVVAENVDEA